MRYFTCIVFLKPKVLLSFFFADDDEKWISIEPMEPIIYTFSYWKFLLKVIIDFFFPSFLNNKKKPFFSWYIRCVALMMSYKFNDSPAKRLDNKKLLAGSKKELFTYIYIFSTYTSTYLSYILYTFSPIFIHVVYI